MNKSLKIAIGIFLFVIAVLLAWYLLFGKGSPDQIIPGTETGLGDSPFGTSEDRPFGSRGGDTPFDPRGIDQSVFDNLTDTTEILRVLSVEPVAGATFVMGKDARASTARWVERATGHVYEASLLASTITRLTNTVIPKVLEAFWVEDGQSVLMRQYDSETDVLDTFYGNIPEKSDLPEGVKVDITGVFLPTNIMDLTVSPDTKRIFYLRKSEKQTEGIVANPDNSQASRIFESPISEWRIAWSSKNIVALTTKAHSKIAGHTFFLSTSGAFDRVYGPAQGLTALASPDAKKILVAENRGKANNPLSLGVINVASGEKTDLRIATLPEKCAWADDSIVLYCAVPIGQSPINNLPETWYQGTLQFSDDIWSINTETEEAHLAMAMSSYRHFKTGETISFDIMNPILSGDFMLFINKNDLTLWEARFQGVR